MQVERAHGVLVGLALGDALGAPFEGRETVADADIRSWCAADEPLRWTDDTHMALTLARHLIDDPTLTHPDGLGTAFADAYAAEPWRGYGSGPPQVFSMVEDGLSFEAAASSLFGGTGSFGNGAAMRVAPIGLLPGAGDPDVAARLAAVQARITHTHPQAIDGAAFVARLIAQLVRLDDPVPDAMAAVVAGAITRCEDEQLRMALIDVTEEIGTSGDTFAAVRRCGTGVATAASVPAAVAAFLSGQQVLPVVTTAIRAGGDTDTIAAIAGAMAGATWGLEQVPERLLARLEARPELERAAAALSALEGRP